MTADTFAPTGSPPNGAVTCLSAVRRVVHDTQVPVPVAGYPPYGSGDLDELHARLGTLTAGYALRNPGAPGIPVEAVRLWMDLPGRHLVEKLVSAPLAVRHRHIVPAAAALRTPRSLAGPLASLTEELAATPFRAPRPRRLAELGFTRAVTATGVQAGLLIRTGEAMVLPIEAVDEAVRVLAGMHQPFTASDARKTLDTTRSVAMSLLVLLDRRGLTCWVGERQRMITPAETVFSLRVRGRTVAP